MKSTEVSTATKVANSIAFRANIDLKFAKQISASVAEPEIITIDSNRISYIMFNNDYYSNNMPVVLLSMKVKVDLYKDIVNYQDKGCFLLSITGYNPLNKRAIHRPKLEKVFRYVTTTQNQPLELPIPDVDMDDSYRTLYLGLVDDLLTSEFRTPFNGIYHNVTMKDLISAAIVSINMGTNYSTCLEPLEYDYTYKQILVPPCSNRLKFLEFLFDYDQFYATYFRFFMDFDKSYLLSQKGISVVDKNDSSYGSVVVDIRPINDANAFSSGYTIVGQSYYIYLCQTDITMNINTSRDQIVNKVIAYGSREEAVSYDISDEEGQRVTFVRNGSGDDPSIDAVNALQSATMTVEFIKKDIDDNIFQPNREIILKMYGDYEKYSGTYLLVYKRYIYSNIGDEFATVCNIGLIPTSDNEPMGVKKKTIKRKSKSTSTSAKKTKSSNTPNGNTKRSVAKTESKDKGKR